MKEDPSSDCGVYLLAFRGWPKYACHWHDHAYTEGSWAESNLTRKQTDDWFLYQMLLMAKNNTPKKVAAWAMYSAVRAFGWIFWEDGKIAVKEEKNDYDPQY